MYKYFGTEVYAMSMKKSVAEKHIRGQADVIVEHTCKIVLYSDIRPYDVNGWINTISRCFSEISDIILKPKGRKPSIEDYEDWILDFFGEDKHDIRHALVYWETKLSRLEHRPYPKTEITDEMVDQCAKFVDTYIEFLDIMNADKGQVDFSVFQSALIELL